LSRYAAWERRVAEIAGGQDNLITNEALIALGVGRNAISHRLASGRWQRLHKGVYLIGPAPPTLSARARAAVFTCGEGSVLSHLTAAQLWGLLPAGEDVHVTVSGRNPGVRQGVQVHRVRRLEMDEVTAKDALPLTTPARTICDLAATEALHEVETALAEARVHRLATDRQLLAVIGGAPTRRGASIVRNLLAQEDDSGYTRSRAERRLRELIRAAGLDRPLFNEPVLGHVVDVVWPKQRLVVEVDGYQYHGHRAAFERDRRRDQELVAAGYRVIRITWLQLRDRPIETIMRIAQALAQH
jgi:very-short-patch-repair endonuclease